MPDYAGSLVFLGFSLYESALPSQGEVDERRHDLPHAVKDGPQVIFGLRGIRQSPIRSDVVLKTVNAPRPPGDSRSARLLDGHDTAERPEVAVRDPGELFLDLLHVITGNVLCVSKLLRVLRRSAAPKYAACCVRSGEGTTYETVVGAVRGFRLETHSSVVGTASLGFLVVRPRRVPSETDQDRSKGAI